MQVAGLRIGGGGGGGGDSEIESGGGDLLLETKKRISWSFKITLVYISLDLYIHTEKDYLFNWKHTSLDAKIKIFLWPCKNTPQVDYCIFW